MLRRLAKKAMDQGLEPVAASIPDRTMRTLLHEATVGLKVAVCLHRVLDPAREFMLQPSLAHTEGELDVFLSLFESIPHRLTMSFDDGYDDARRYIDSRAPDTPDVNWLFFVCPAKVKSRFGFAWDAFRKEGGENPLAFAEQWQSIAARKTEHAKKNLQHLADDDNYRLSSVEEIRALGRHANVSLGDHTDHHIPTAWMSADDVRAELEQSRAGFVELFGPPQHFAFPYGTPGLFVLERDIEIVRETHNATTWLVDVHPYRTEDAFSGAALPRFAWNSEAMSPKGMALYIALKCAAARFRRR